MSAAHNRREYVRFGGTLADVEGRRQPAWLMTQYPRHMPSGSDFLPPWITHRVHALLAETSYKPSLSGDLGSTYAATHDPQQVAPCAMWEAGAGCCGSMGMPCQAFHDPELLCLNTCEMSKGVCQGFGCFRVVDNGPHHHDAWMMDVNYFMYEPPPTILSDSEEGEEDEDAYAGHCWLVSLVKDVEHASKDPLDDTGYQQVKWFMSQLRPPPCETHFCAAGPGLTPMMYHLAHRELKAGPDFTSYRHYEIHAQMRHRPVKFLDTPCDLRQPCAGTNKFIDVYTLRSPSNVPSSS